MSHILNICFMNPIYGNIKYIKQSEVYSKNSVMLNLFFIIDLTFFFFLVFFFFFLQCWGWNPGP
jgi:hypothetical protein